MDDTALAWACKHKQPEAMAELVKRYGDHIRRVLIRVLGAADPDRLDLLQEVFARALRASHQIKSLDSLKAWLTRIAVFTAREHIRRRSRHRWLVFAPELPEVAADLPSDGIRDATRCVYAIFDQLPVDERIPFVLRVLDGYDLDELADVCDVSYGTLRRRLARAEKRFFKLAARYEALQPWMTS
jgi:RNA polymerase sigma-70 factor (ECF subfamily)